MRYLLYISLLFFCSCTTDLPDRNELIDLYYEAKVENLLEDKDVACRKRAIAMAKADVDSLIALRFNADILDSIQFPTRPIRPQSPEHIINKVQKFELDSIDNK